MSEALDVWSGTEVEIAGQQLETYEDHVVAWHHLDGEEDDLNWIRGAVVASLVVKYGEETIPRYAKDVGRPISTIKLYRQTFKAYQQEDEKAKRLAFSGLKWWHYVIALRAPEEDRPAILELAATTRCPDHANGDDPVAGHLPWRGRELARYIAERFKQPSPPLPPGTFTTIVADPPWPYDAGWPEYADAAGDKNPRRPLPYQPMSIEEISGLDVLGLAAPDSHLFLWTTNRYVRDAYAVAESWGFEPSQLLVWCKKPRGIGPGGIFSNTAEFIIYARRGSPPHKERTDSTWWEWPRGKHSTKPNAFLELVEGVCEGPYLEMFARQQRPGWDAWGLEV